MEPFENGKLRRIGDFEIVLLDIARSKPPHDSLSGAALSGFWTWLVEGWLELHPVCDGPFYEASAWDQVKDPRFGPFTSCDSEQAELRVKSIEAVLALIHRAVAPKETALCGHDCPHVKVGLHGNLLKRFYESILHAHEPFADRMYATHFEDSNICHEWDEQLVVRNSVICRLDALLTAERDAAGDRE